MPRNTYGSTVKARVKRLLEALLSFVNWEFEESGLDIEFKWEAEDSANPKLIVRTRRVVLERLTAKDKYPGQLTDSQIREALKILKNFLKILKDNRTQTKGVDTWHFTLTLWSKDKEKNLQQFEKAWEDNRPDKSKALEETFKKAPLTPQFWGEQDQTTSVLPPKVGGGIDWHNICLGILEKQKRLTTNELLSADEDMKFELNDIHVPLALVQRTKPDKRSGDVSPEEGSRLLQPTYEEKQRFKHEEFLAQVLQEGKGQSKGRRIAVIGEPGAGKTTLLQSIAFWLLEDKNKNLGLPIWISLADLQGKTLEEYLLQRWLKNALGVVRVTPEQENALVELFKQERVWLFLDGVDEIAGSSLGAIHDLPLQMVASQLEGWVAKARVVLSCRLNVWEANLNALGDDFEKYRLLDFDYPFQVKEFICHWFRKTGADKGEQLWTELDKSERQRIQDLVKNPLRLALLCSTWQSSDKGLPSTKAGLYQRFVEVFYTWKKNCFPTTFEQRQELNAALGSLALRGIDSEESRFRLRHKVVCEVLGDPEQKGSLFGLALQLGWLNKVGLAAESETQEKVYAFYHPTFQEYFAALAIDDWHEFLNHVPDNPAQGTYRIFKSQWKEVILLWLGRDKDEVPDKQKEEFIQALVEFEDGCKNFYRDRAYYLAAAGIAEFEDCPRSDVIVARIIRWAFGYFNLEKQKWVSFVTPISKAAKIVLKETIRTRAIAALVELIENCKSEIICVEATVILEAIGQRSFTAIEIIPKYNYMSVEALVESSQNLELDEEDTEPNLENLWEIYKGNSIAVETLVKLIEDSQDQNTLRYAAYSLGIIGEGNSKAITALVELIRNSQDENTLQQAAKSLGKIDRGNPTAIATLTELIENSQDDSIRLQAILSLARIDESNPKAIYALVQLIDNSHDKDTLLHAIGILGQIAEGNPTAITTLVNLTQNSQDLSILRHAVAVLGEIGKGNFTAITALVKLTQNFQDEVFAEYILEEVIRSLGKVGKSNPIAITTLVELIGNLENKSDYGRALCRTAADSLKKILAETQMAEVVIILKDYLDENNSWRFQNYYDVIWHCAQNLPYPAFHQAWHPQEEVEKTTTSDPQSLNQADLPQSLQSAITNDPQLSQTIHLICIDSNQFIEPDNPAEIYDQMLDQNCPECDRVPETMSALKLYWNSLQRNSNKHPFLLFYASSTNPYNETFLTVLSKFGREIGVITDQPLDHIPLKYFAPSQSITDILEWIRTK